MPSLSPEQPQSISEHRVFMVEVLNKVLEVFCTHSAKTFDEVMENALLLISDILGCDQICVDRSVETAGGYNLVRVYQWIKHFGGIPTEEIIPIRQHPVTAKWVEALENGGYIYKKSSDATEIERVFMESTDVKMIIIVPIFTHGRLWGNVAFRDSNHGLNIDEDCMDLVQSFAHLCANAFIRNEMLLEIIRQNDVNKKTARDAEEAEERTRLMLDAFPLCCQLWTRDCKIIDCNKTALELFGAKTKEEFIETFFEFAPEFQPDGRQSLDVARENVATAFEKGRSTFDFAHVLQDGALLPAEVTLVRVSYKGDYVVAGFTKDLRQIKTMEKDILRLETESEKIYYDSLTGIYNRRYFDENLSRALNTLSRSKGSLSLMMLDIDHFKSYNDSYGHGAGDECLIAVAETLSNNTSRADDFVVRYGGDEFAIVLPNTEESGARMIAEKLLESIRNCVIPHTKTGKIQAITASIGVTTGKVGQKQRADDFILRADELLYKSKQNGRDRYTFGKL